MEHAVQRPSPPSALSVAEAAMKRLAAAQALLGVALERLSVMSGVTNEGAIEAATAAIGADLTTVAADLTTISNELASLISQLQPGSTVSAADVSALQAVKAQADALVTQAQSVVNAGTVASTGTVTNPGT